MRPLSTVHRPAGAYLEGALLPAEEEAFLDHLGECDACRDELRAEIQLRDREDSLRSEAAERARIATERIDALPIAIARRRRRWRGPAALAAGGVALAAVIALAIGARRPVTPRPTSVLALAPTRGLMPRLTYGPAAAYRPYSVARGSTSERGPAIGQETIGYDLLATLEEAGDCHGLATAHVLLGELDRAGRALAACAGGPDLDADRAALALLRDEPEQAIELADRALSAAPAHAAARWNRALALESLGLGLTAAADFDAAAAAEDGWADEARTRAEAVRRPLAAVRASWTQILADGNRMIGGGPPLAHELALRHSWRARIVWTHALRAASTAARLDELRPLAAALEGHAGTGLVAQLDAARRDLRPARARLAAGYARWAIDQKKSDAVALDRWLREARVAGLRDLVAATLVVTSRDTDDDEALDLATALDDAWLLAEIRIDRASAARGEGRLTDALVELDAADAICAAHDLPYRCLQAELVRARVETEAYRPPAMKRLGRSALDHADRLGEWAQRALALLPLAAAERYRERFSVATAYYREYAEAVGTCPARTRAASAIAYMLFNRRRLVEASGALASVDDCVGDQPMPVLLATDISLERAGHRRRPRADVLADLARLRTSPTTGAVMQLDLRLHEARARLDDDPAARDELETLIGDAARDVERALSAQVTGPAEALLLVDAGRRHAFDEVLRVAARTRGLPTPARCALVLSADDFRFVAVAVAADGAIRGEYRPDLLQAPPWRAPPDLEAHLRGCAEVDVLATPPWFGVGPLFAGDLAWRYVLGPARLAAGGRHVIVTVPSTPPSLGLATLAPLPELAAGATVLQGTAATPKAALAAFADASLIEVHAHAVSSALSDAPALALAGQGDDWALTAEAIAGAHLRSAPVVLLADCGGGVPAAYEHVAWGLPPAFLAAGARSVVASLAPIPDREGAEVFAELRRRIAAGTPVTLAVAGVRAAKIAADPTSWVRDLVVFE